MIHIIRITGITAILLLCMFLPFLPGRYDSLAITLSSMTQVFSFTGLLLVPIGLMGLVLRKRKSSTRFFAKVSLFTAGIVAVTVSVGAFSKDNLFFGIIFIAFCFSLLAGAYKKIRHHGFPEGASFNTILLYLVTIPTVTFLARFIFITPAVEFSRNTAIRNSEPLIQAIENYCQDHGQYPASLQALHADYYPAVIGIPRYHYEPNGDAYNLHFKQFSDELDVEEIVMYNKLDQHHFAAHTRDILEFTGDDLAIRRGDRRRYPLSAPHWISIKFD